MNADRPQSSIERQPWRTARQDDEAHLFALFSESKQADFALLALAGQAIEPLIAMQHRARALEYAARFPLAENRVLVSKSGEFVGRLLVDRSGPVWRLVDIGVFARFRGEGIATRAITQLCYEADHAEAQVELSTVRCSPADRLYQRLGFVPFASEDPVLLHMRYESRGCSHHIASPEIREGRAA
jgi:GNAT superfamily N-acetyltransferase